MFFSLPSWAVALIVFAVIGAATAAGYATGHYLREHQATLREPFGVLQAALLGVVGLILAFGLTLAVGRYEARRAALVTEANAIGTTYLRGQLLADEGIPAVGKAADPVEDPRPTECALDLLVGGLGARETDVLADGGREEVRVLSGDGDRPADVLLPVRA